MIALDTSSLVAYLSDEAGCDVEAVEVALAEHQACLPPAVLAELLSAPRLPPAAAALFKQLPVLPVIEGYWERVGALRADVIAQGRKARLADALIAQSCLDHAVPLITRDAEFRHFARVRELELVLHRARVSRSPTGR